MGQGKGQGFFKCSDILSGADKDMIQTTFEEIFWTLRSLALLRKLLSQNDTSGKDKSSFMFLRDKLSQMKVLLHLF